VELILLLGLILTFMLSTSAAGYLVLRRSHAVADRLRQLPAPPLLSDFTAEGTAPEMDSKRLLSIRKKAFKAPLSMAEATQTQKLLHHAGYRSGTALATYGLYRIASLAVFPAAFLLGTLRVALHPATRFLGIALLALAGYVLPKLILRILARRRQHRLRLSLPDALDLLVVCVEAGMGLNQAIVKVAEELEQTHKEISDELKLVNLEIRAGRSRGEALRNLGERTGVDDIISLAAMLIQTDKFGTSIARSLRVHSDSLRTERIQRAEEAAAKTTIKLIFPLLFCIFPALLVVILGPAFLNLARIFSETLVQNAK
jgi:tight adherence protein C